jgi:hypothetical protein
MATTATKTTTTSEAAESPSPVEARRQLEQAQVHLEDLTARLGRGDFSVRQSDLSEAQERVSYLEHVAKGAEAADQRRQAEERDEAGRRLHDEFLADVAGVVGETDQALRAMGQAVVVAVNALDAIGDLRNGYQARWNEIHRGHTEDPSALLFKFGGDASGSFGAVAEGRVLPRVDVIETVMACVGEALTGRSRGEMSGADMAWWDRLRQPQIASGLRALRALVEFFASEERAGAEDPTTS